MAFEFLVETEAAKTLTDGVTTSPVFRSKISDGELVTELHGNRTIFELFSWSCETFAARPLHGKREKYVGEHVGGFLWQSYAEVEETVQYISKAMRIQGCTSGAKIGIYGPNAPEWTQAMLACSYFAAVCVPLYDTLGADAVEHAILHGEIEFIFVSEKHCKALGNVVNHMGPKANQIREICIWSDYSNVSESELTAATQIFKEAGIHVENWTDLIQRGKATQAAALQGASPAADPESMAVLMYTSGTTGVPKGVVLSNRAITAAVASTIFYGQKTNQLPEHGVHLSWLTCAHVYGFIMELVSIAAGGKIGYWQGRADKLLDDVSTLQPTQFIAVPRIWSRIMDRVTHKIEERGTIAKYLFDTAYAYKKSVLESGSQGDMVTAGLDYLFFSRVLEALGGHVHYVGSGAAPLPRHVEEFLRVTLTVPVIQGYGLTETCAVTCASLPNRYDHPGTVGTIMPCAELRLQSVPEMGYDARGSSPSGEICFRGPCLFSTYYKNSEEYEKAVDADGFFHTGDVGELQPSGALKIIDRIKNIFKLSQGEYVAVEKIESVLQKASTVGQIWVYGDSCQRFLVAIVHPTFHKVKHLLHEGSSLEDVCKSEAVKNEVLKELTETGRASGLKGFERVQNIGLVPEEFSVENGLMTPSQKLKRHDLLKRYKDIIDSLYSEANAS